MQCVILLIFLHCLLAEDVEKTRNPASFVFGATEKAEFKVASAARHVAAQEIEKTEVQPSFNENSNPRFSNRADYLHECCGQQNAKTLGRILSSLALRILFLML